MILIMSIDGQDYPIDGDLTPRELGYVKRLSGVRAGELEDALGAGDVEVIVALAMIAARRAGQSPDENQLLDGKAVIGARLAGVDGDRPDAPSPGQVLAGDVPPPSGDG